MYITVDQYNAEIEQLKCDYFELHLAFDQCKGLSSYSFTEEATTQMNSFLNL